MKLSEARIGQKVRFVEAGFRTMTKDKIYTVTNMDHTFIIIVNDYNDVAGFFPGRFEPPKPSFGAWYKDHK